MFLKFMRELISGKTVSTGGENGSARKTFNLGM
jgi:hypothetical protein